MKSEENSYKGSDLLDLILSIASLIVTELIFEISS